MKALITGASSGIGEEFARQLSAKGYDIIAVARRFDRLEKLKDELPTEVTPIACDLSSTKECIELFEKVKNENIDIVINNAGFGLLGTFLENDLERELSMIDVNCKAMHILMKLFLRKFSVENKGYILNVCSIGGHLPGPLLSAYYATKAYVLSLTRGVYEEVRRSGKNIYVGCLCPGPVDTEFSSVANVRFSLKSRSAKEVVKYALNKMFKRKLTILPGIEVKLTALSARLAPTKLLLRISYNVQHKKI